MEHSPVDLFSAFAHETRLRCLMLLAGQQELCVCELTYALNISQPHVSRHLALLRESGLVSDRRAGTWVYYRINPQLPVWMKKVLDEMFDGIGGRPPYRDDARLLRKMPERPDAPRCA